MKTRISPATFDISSPPRADNGWWVPVRHHFKRGVIALFILCVIAAAFGCSDDTPSTSENALIAAVSTGTPGMLPPGAFTAIIQSGTSGRCLIFGANGTAQVPQGFLWGPSTANCGLSSVDALVQNQQAVFTFVPIQDDLYMLQNASLGPNQCLTAGSGRSPTRIPWVNGTSTAYCGASSRDELLQARRSVWRIVPQPNNQYAITNTLDGDVVKALILDLTTADRWAVLQDGQPTYASEVYWTITPVAQSLTRGLIGWYRGETDTGNSAAAGGNGLANGSVNYSQGQVGSAFTFNGTNAAIQLPNMWPVSQGVNPVTGSSAAALSAWISIATQPPNTQRWILGASGAIQLNVTGDGYVMLQFRGGDGSFRTLVDPVKPQAGAWYQYTGSVSSVDGSNQTTMILYRNGQRVAAQTYNLGMAPDNGCRSWIGGVADAQAQCAYTGQYFQGSIDEVRLYNRALSDSEVTMLYYTDSARVPAPLAWYRGEVNANDSASLAVGLPIGHASYATGELGQAFSFYGGDSAVMLSSISELASSQATLGAWVNSAAIPSTQTWIVGAMGRTQITLSASNQITLGFFGADNQWHTIPDPVPLQTGQWVHYIGTLAATQGSTTMTLYRNGQAVATQTYNVVSATDNGCHAWIGGVNEPAGACAYRGQFFNGAIDEVQVFPQVLSAAQVAAVYWLQYSNAASAGVSDQLLAQKFAPRLRFDASAAGYPMSAQVFWRQSVVTPQPKGAINQNVEYLPVARSQVPTYYQVISCGAGQKRIRYWFFYGYQSDCTVVGVPAEDHNGDWEYALVTLSQDMSKAAAVTFSWHGDYYTRLGGLNGFTIEEGTHPVVYVGRITHESSHQSQTASGLFSCLPWYEPADNSTGTHMDTWNNLASLDTNEEPWMPAAKSAPFIWGYKGVSTNPPAEQLSCSQNASKSTNSPLMDQTGTEARSQCMVGDSRISGYNIIHDYCEHPRDLLTTSYGLNYPLPVTDFGLLVPYL